MFRKDDTMPLSTTLWCRWLWYKKSVRFRCRQIYEESRLRQRKVCPLRCRCTLKFTIRDLIPGKTVFHSLDILVLSRFAKDFAFGTKELSVYPLGGDCAIKLSVFVKSAECHDFWSIGYRCCCCWVNGELSRKLCSKPAQACRIACWPVPISGSYHPQR